MALLPWGFNICVFVCQRCSVSRNERTARSGSFAFTRAGLTAYPLLKVRFFRFVDTLKEYRRGCLARQAFIRTLLKKEEAGRFLACLSFPHLHTNHHGRTLRGAAPFSSPSKRIRKSRTTIGSLKFAIHPSHVALFQRVELWT